MNHREMKWVLLLGVTLALLSSGSAGAGPFSELKPIWRIGQTWEIEVEHEIGPPSKPPEEMAKFKPHKRTVTHRFTVEGRVEMEGETCYQIRAQGVRIDDQVTTSITYLGRLEFHRLYFRKDDLTLKCVERIRRERGNPDDILDHSRKFERMPVGLGTNLGFPLSWPVFDMEQDVYDAEKDSPLVRNKTPIRRRYEADQRCRMEDEAKNGKQEKVLRIEFDDRVSANRTKPVVQVWRKGMPWWSTEESEYNGVRVPARLVKVDGKAVSP